MPNDLKEPILKSSRLQRVTLLVTIIAVLSTPAFAYIGAILGFPPYKYDPTAYQYVVLIATPVVWFSPLYIAWIPFLIVRKWRLLCGIYLMLLSFFFLSLISYSWITYGDTDKWHKSGSWIVYFLPPWILTCISGLFHIMLWWKERKQHRI